MRGSLLQKNKKVYDEIVQVPILYLRPQQLRSKANKNQFEIILYKNKQIKQDE